MRRPLLILLASALVAGCASPETGAPPAPSTERLASGLNLVESGEAAGVTLDPLGEATLLVAVEPPARARQRLNIDQLSASLERITGGVNWVAGEATLWEILSATLGRPDYIQTTQEDLLPSALFHKFLDDAARQICADLVSADLLWAAGEGQGAPHLLVYVDPADALGDDEATSENLSHLLLAFHGRRVAPGSPELVQWRWLVDTVGAASSEPTEAWNAVCVALITHPNFYSY